MVPSGLKKEARVFEGVCKAVFSRRKRTYTCALRKFTVQ